VLREETPRLLTKLPFTVETRSELQACLPFVRQSPLSLWAFDQSF
jgi:hypothetical protein